NPFFVIIGDTMEEEAKKHGYDMIRMSGEKDVNKQAGQIDEFITKGVAAIVINPCDSKSIGAAIKRANDAGIPVFTNDIKYDGDLGKVITHVATDNYQGGRLAGEAMVKAIGGTGGKVGILHFPQVESCQLRVKGFNEVIDAHNESATDNKIKVVATLDGGGLRDEGFVAAQEIIQGNKDLRAFFAINDPSALGAYAALEDAGKVDQVLIVGFDGELAGKKAILEGKILCDPVQFPRQIGKKTIESIVKHFDGEEVEAEILIPSALYYKADAEKDPELQGETAASTTEAPAKDKDQAPVEEDKPTSETPKAAAENEEPKPKDLTAVQEASEVAPAD
ncbi:MAG: substrate-binding domain-containing protein, partial [Pirellulales bacterium]|nr:substrate-binding domain-containing protein [Pirellulales bacterium]